MTPAKRLRPLDRSAKSSMRSVISRIRLPVLSNNKHRQPVKSVAMCLKPLWVVPKSPKISPKLSQLPRVPPKELGTCKCLPRNSPEWLQIYAPSLSSTATDRISVASDHASICNRRLETGSWHLGKDVANHGFRNHPSTRWPTGVGLLVATSQTRCVPGELEHADP